MTVYKIMEIMDNIADLSLWEDVWIDERIDALNIVKVMFIKQNPYDTYRSLFRGDLTDDEIQDILYDCFSDIIESPNLGNYLIEEIFDSARQPMRITPKERQKLWKKYDKHLNKLLYEYRLVFNSHVKMAKGFDQIPQYTPNYKPIDSVCNKLITNTRDRKVKKLWERIPHLDIVKNEIPPHFISALNSRVTTIPCENCTHDRGTCNLVKELINTNPETENKHQGGD